MLIKFANDVPYLSHYNTYMRYLITACSAIIRFMIQWVCLEPVTACWYENVIKCRHHCMYPTKPDMIQQGFFVVG